MTVSHTPFENAAAKFALSRANNISIICPASSFPFTLTSLTLLSSAEFTQFGLSGFARGYSWGAAEYRDDASSSAVFCSYLLRRVFRIMTTKLASIL